MPLHEAHAPSAPKVALVLAGGAARGAYEVGVVQHIVEEVSRDLGHDVPLDILCGTSVGALNACALAAFADDPRAGVARLIDIWTALRVADLVRVDLHGLLAMGKDLLRSSSTPAVPARECGLLDARGLEGLLSSAIPFERIDEHLRKGHLSAVTVSTTHVKSGRTIVFVQRAEPGLPPWSHDPTITPRAAALRVEHALASAAIPMLFRSVRIDGEFHCDGGLRQNVPLSPARRLGASGVIVINPRYVGGSEPPLSRPSDEVFPGPFFLLGKTLNALLLDRIDTDLARLQSINRILDAGRRRYGASFVGELNMELRHPTGGGLRPLRVLLIRASQDIGTLCAEFIHSPSFHKRVGGVLGRIMRRLAEGDEAREADLLSYLLFDGEFARQLIEIGRADARARHEELCAFFAAERERDLC
jgi:NTE family protein